MGPKLVDLLRWSVTLCTIIEANFRITRSHIFRNSEKSLQIEFPFKIELKALHVDALSRRIVDKTHDQARSKCLKNGFNRVRTNILAKEYRWFVSLKNEWLGSRCIFLASPKETLDLGARMTPLQPIRRRAETKPRQIGVFFDGSDSLHELVDIDAIWMGSSIR